jgi:DNA-binding MarR family transcriptional regulator
MENINYLCTQNIKLINMDSICQLKDIYKSLYRFEKEFQSRYDMTINEAMVLCFLYSGETHTAGDICDFIGLSASRVSKVINSVENLGYIERNISPTDKRQMLFVLTTSGLRKITEMKKSNFTTADLYQQLRECVCK